MKPKKIFKKYLLGIFNLSYYNQLSKSPPIIIGGCGRSGTTLLLSILAAHPKIHAITNETGELTKDKLNNPSTLISKIFIASHLKKEINKNAVRWAEKTPNNVNNIDQILKFFKGNVKIVHIVRDGRNVITSKHPTLKNKFWVKKERWINDVTNGLKFLNHKNVYTIKYEDIVDDFNNSISKLLEFLEIEMVDEIINYQKHTSIKRHLAWDSNVKSIYKITPRLDNPENKDVLREFMEDKIAIDLMKRLSYL